MNADEKHVCMLPKEPKYMDVPPTGGWFLHLMCKIREWRLPCEWHHGSVMFLRSHTSMRRERERQVTLGHWPTWHPYSPAKFYWDCASMLVGLTALLYTPLMVFSPCPSPYNYKILIADAVGLIDVLIKFNTGNDHDGNKVILETKEIARRYVRGTFIFDLISALPFQLIGPYTGCRYPLHTSWHILKLFKLIAVSKAWMNVSKQYKLSFVLTSGLIAIVRLILFFHWITYIYRQIPIVAVHYHHFEGLAKKWMKRFQLEELQEATMFTKYSTSLYYSCSLIIGAGKVNAPHLYLVGEMIINSFVGIVGLIFLVYICSAFIRLAAYSCFEMFLYDGRLKELQEYMVFKQLPSSLQRKILLFINYKFYEHFYNEQAIRNTINEQIKQTINMHCCKQLVMNVPLFQDMPPVVINAIVFKLVQVIYMPGETVMKLDQPGNSIYLIYSGTVAVINEEGREVAHLRDGSYFGENALLNPGSLRTSTTIALEITEIFKLSRHEFQSCLQPYPHLKRRLDVAPGPRQRRRAARRARDIGASPL